MRGTECRIEAVLYQSRYAETDHWVMSIDGVALDEWLESGTMRSQKFAGLVPALGNLIQRDEESIAWQRILPLPGCTTIAPLLVCPEHKDFSCMVVLAEVFHGENQIIWKRFGINVASAASPDDIGSTVEWIPELGPLVFEMQAYLDCLDRFHLLRLSRNRDLEGKAFAILLLGVDETGTDTWALLRGEAHASTGGITIELPEPARGLELRSEWIPRIRPVAPELKVMFEGAEVCLPLQLKNLSPEIRAELGLAEDF